MPARSRRRCRAGASRCSTTRSTFRATGRTRRSSKARVALGQTATLHLQVNAGTPLKAVLVWTDPPGTVSTGTTPNLVNDLDLRIGSLPSQADHINNVEVISIAAPTSGTYAIDVTAARLGFGSKQSYALVVTGDVSEAPAARVRAVRH